MFSMISLNHLNNLEELLPAYMCGDNETTYRKVWAIYTYIHARSWMWTHVILWYIII